MTKTRLQGEDAAAKDTAQRVLCYVLKELLALLHPFMPFITEEIWQALPHQGDFLMMESWPTYREELNFPTEEQATETVMEAIGAIRSRRAEMNVPPSKKARLIVATAQEDAFRLGSPVLQRLAYGSEVVFVTEAELAAQAQGMVSVTTYAAKILMPLAELVDLDKERARIQKEMGKVQADLDKIQTKLGNPGFLAKAPDAVVDAEREKCEKLATLLQKLQEQVDSL